MKFATIFLLILIPAFAFPQGIDYKGFPEWTLQKKDSTEYALYTPRHLQTGKKYPIVLFMHGCCGVDYHASLRNAVDPPVSMWHHFGNNRQSIPTYIISPATSKGWSQHFKNLKAVIDDLIANQQGDPQRIYVCGFSMGAMGTYQIIQEYPGYFAAAIAMGMNFSGDSTKVKNIPLWMNQGETDPFSKTMRIQVAGIRALNGLVDDTGSTWVTGVNPRYSNFTGVGHVVQWPAASTQDLTGWAYSKINDGNQYPIIFFEPVVQIIPAVAGKPINIHINASDPDGSISRVDVFRNHVLLNSISKAPFDITIHPVHGDNNIEAKAYDNGGKSNTCQVIIRVPVTPKIITIAIPPAQSGKYYQTILKARGNGAIIFSLKDDSGLPKGIQLYPGGVIKGIATANGVFIFSVKAIDVNQQQVIKTYKLTVGKKAPGEPLLTNISTREGREYKLAKMRIGEAPFFNSKDTVATNATEEINFSELGSYEGFTFIKTDVNDADQTAREFLQFNSDENIIVYVAYEKLDGVYQSRIPEWLKSFKQEPGQITAQYRYFNIYSKSFKKGKIILPAADAKSNGVSSNYFIMIRNQ